MQNAEKRTKQMVKDTINEFQGTSAEAVNSIVFNNSKYNLKMNTMFLVFSMIAYHSFFIIF